MKGEVLAPEVTKQLVSEAKQLDAEIGLAVTDIKKNIAAISKLTVRIKDKSLWKYLLDPKTKKEFRSWEKYARHRLGPISHTKLAELAAVGSLTEGPHALSDSTVNAIGHKRSVILSKAPAHKRKKLVQSALTSTPEKYAQDVQETINEGKPIGEQKEATIPWCRNYPVSLVAQLKDLEARAMWMEELNDADFSISREAKFMYAMVVHFEANFETELEAADKLRTAGARKALAQAKSNS